MRINRYLPLAVVYFFFNAAGLPHGLTYTTLLAPFLYVWVIRKRQQELLLPFLAIMAPFIILQLTVSGAEPLSYALSFFNLLLVYLFCQAVYTFFITAAEPGRVFRKLLVLNFIFCLLAIALYFTPFSGWVWMQQNVSGGLEGLKRLKMFTYEPSHYALLFIPLFFFFLLEYIFRQNRVRPALLLLMIFLPLVLSFSFGVIAAAVLAGILATLFRFRSLVGKRRVLNGLVYTFFITGGTLLVLLVFFRDNVLFTRLQNILLGSDTSANGRTTDAYRIAETLLDHSNAYWGLGPGQIKISGENIIRSFYLYYDNTPVAIPNASAETLALFGWVGFSLRLFTEVFLFFYTRVWNNYYRLLIFFFVFIYQFTGSFITNAPEYILWILAFTPVFRQFDVPVKQQSLIHPPGWQPVS